MAWVSPQYSKGQVDAAGRDLVSDGTSFKSWIRALEILNNWRSAHGLPLNTMQVNLRRRARVIYPHALIAQRLKRVPSTIEKLRRFPKMNLSRMQDIGGCRAVLSTVRQVQALHHAYLDNDSHELVHQKDYILAPKSSGYRGVHLVYRYQSARSTEFNGLQVEIQLRSRLQHAWATAVETVGTFLTQSLKASEGSESWLRFFSLTSSAFAIMERSPLVPDTPASAKELQLAVAEMDRGLDVKRVLGMYGGALEVTAREERKSAHYFLLALNPSETVLEIRQYDRQQLPEATERYLELETRFKDEPGAQAVLVAADSLDALRRAYPNYFLDTRRFLFALDQVLAGPSRASVRVR